MVNISVWFGLFSSGGVLAWILMRPGTGRNIFDLHGLLIVFGGLASAMLINTSLPQILSSLRTLLWVLFPASLPSPADTADELARLSRRARTEGGILALRGEGGNFANGFLKYALETVAACGETSGAREILDIAIRRKRIQRQEDANVIRTMATLAPMFGLLGTLVGMLQVLNSMSEPTRLGPAMALALSSAFIGIGIANFVCVPLAGHVRSQSMRETQILEMIVEGILEISINRPTFQVELKLAAYQDLKRGADAEAEAAREAP
ncbi:MAG: MotA/TolQ/ExbB proton channel family protein [Elusimicrobia bacterium]|nr:MotA/TolQ/ExbB proton channel family protein [Elusimicrobiota bacterium]